MNKSATSVKSAATKTRKSKVVEPTVETVETTPVVTETVPVVTETTTPVTGTTETVTEATPVTGTTETTVTFRQRLETLITSRTELIATLKQEVQELRKLQRDHDNMIKEATRKPKKVKAARDFTKPKKASGFAEPVIVSDELYSFLVKNKATMKDHTFVPSSAEEEANWPRVPVVAGQPVARTDVTSFISKYIKENNLQNPEMKREILPNAGLKKIFTNPAEPARESFNYLQLQKYISHHFTKRA